MANKFDGKETAEKKVSSLSGDTLTPLSRSGSGAGKRGGNKKETSVYGRRRFSWRGLVVDLVLLVILCGIGVGAWFGYRTVKDLYMPTWETRPVEICVEIPNVNYDRANQLLLVLEGQKLWHSAKVDGDCLGVIQSVDFDLNVTAEGQEVMTLSLTMTTEAEYHSGEGYFVGSTRILAGEAGKFRTEGFVGDGLVVSLRDLSEVTS